MASPTSLAVPGPSPSHPCLAASSHARPCCAALRLVQRCILDLLLDVAQGMEYLHQRGVVHGELRAGESAMSRLGRMSERAPSVQHMLGGLH